MIYYVTRKELFALFGLSRTATYVLQNNGRLSPPQKLIGLGNVFVLDKVAKELMPQVELNAKDIDQLYTNVMLVRGQKWESKSL